MAKALTSVPGWTPELGTRFSTVIERVGGLRAASTIVGTSDEQIAKWRDGKAKAPFGAVLALAQAANVSVDWLATGAGEMRPGEPAAEKARPEPNAVLFGEDELVMIPRYDAALAAGAGALNEGGRIVGYMPFPRAWLIRRLGRSTAKGLAIIEVRGDSMEPTLGDGDLVTLDMLQTAPGDGLVALVLEDYAQVKRLQVGVAGVDLISDNRDVYPTQRLTRDEARGLKIIGRVVGVTKLM